MKPKDYLIIITDLNGFVSTPRLQWVIKKNPRKTAREEAIAAEVLRQANPRENITGNFPWGPEEQMVLQQLWIGPNLAEWRDVPIRGAEGFFSNVDGMPVPNAIKEPGVVRGDFRQKLRKTLREDE